MRGRRNKPEAPWISGISGTEIPRMWDYCKVRIRNEI